MFPFFLSQTKLLLFGFLVILFSNFGQTWFISIFNLEIRELLNLSNGEFGFIYSLATILSALMLVWFGKIIDLIDLRIYSTISALGLALACLAMFFLFENFFIFFLIILSLRFFGQGAMSHTGITTLSRYYDADRGKAISIGSFGMPFGEMIIPLITVTLISIFSWQNTWLFAASSIIFIFIPLSLYLLKDHNKRHSEFLLKQKNAKIISWKINEVIKDIKLYIYLPITLLPAFVVTGLLFHQIFIATSKGWSLKLIATSFVGYALFSFVGLIFGGPIVDKIDSKKLIPFYLLPMFIGILLMMTISNIFVIFPYMALLGLTHGLHVPFTGALWAELYGVLNLGAVRGLLHACGVFASALSPFLFGVFIDYSFGYFFIGFFCLVLIFISSYPPFIFMNK